MQRSSTFDTIGSKNISRVFETSFFTPPLGIEIMLEMFHSTAICLELKLLSKISLSDEDT